MEDRFCPTCGTEIGSDARFCPTCGQVLVADAAPEGDELEAGTEEGQAAIPAAPAWPQPDPQPQARPEPEVAPQAEPEPAADGVTDSPTADEAAPAAAEPEPAAREGAAAGGEPTSAGPPPPPPPAAPPPAAPPPAQGPDTGPLTLPTMLSGWLIGAGAGFGALALLPKLGNILSVLLFVGLLWVTATVFLADRMPQFAHQRLLTLVVILVALGAALDRAGFRLIGVDSIFLIAVLVAAAGILLVETGRDRPAPPPGGTT